VVANPFDVVHGGTLVRNRGLIPLSGRCVSESYRWRCAGLLLPSPLRGGRPSEARRVGVRETARKLHHPHPVAALGRADPPRKGSVGAPPYSAGLALAAALAAASAATFFST